MSAEFSKRKALDGPEKLATNSTGWLQTST
jgi:hypothetical protein